MQLGTYLRGRDNLSVKVSTGIPIGMYEHVEGGLVQGTVTSLGDRPIGVSSLQLKLTGGKYVPFMEYLPLEGSRKLPAVLKRGEWSTYWLAGGPLRRELAASGLRIEKVIAILSDGRRVERSVDPSFRRLGER